MNNKIKLYILGVAINKLGSDDDDDDDVCVHVCMCAYCVGEGQVYTVGRIGKRRVVSTKLSRIGREAETSTATRSTVTRLLGKSLSTDDINYRRAATD